MSVDADKIGLITIGTEVSSSDITESTPSKVLNIENISKVKNLKASNPSQDDRSRKISTRTSSQIDEAAEDRQRTGRYLAVGVTLIMIFIAFYHTVLRHATVLAGLLAPAIIMLLYILWLLYFAKKKKTQVSTV